MNVRLTFLIALTAPLSLLVCLCPSHEKQKGAGELPLLDRLRSADATTRSLAFESLQLQRVQAIEALLAVMQATDEQSHHRYAQAEAIQLLGEYRVTEAKHFLIKNAHRSFPGAIWEVHPLNYCRAARALVEIDGGVPAEIINSLGRSPRSFSDHHLRVLAFVIYCIDRKELGLARLEIALDQETKSTRGSSDRKNNLKRLIEIYKVTDFADPKQWPRAAEDAARK